MPLLEFDNVHAGYGKKEVLRGLTFSIEPGQIVVLLGGNGAGKSTALKVAAGILRPWSGRVRFNGEDITGTLPHEVKRRGLSYFPQGGRVFKSLTVGDNLAVAGWGGGKITESHLFPQLRELWSHRAGLLSGGERQMLAIQMMLSRPSMGILMDEPGAGLAERLASAVMERVRHLASNKSVGILLVEQNIQQACRIADHVCQLETGCVKP